MPAYLIPEATLIVYGRVEKANKQEVVFLVEETLRGDAQKIRIDASQEPATCGCAGGLLVWPTDGEPCCLFLTYNKETKRHEVAEYGAGIRKMPYRGQIDLEMMRLLVTTWDQELQDTDWKQAKPLPPETSELGRLVYALSAASGQPSYDQALAGLKEHLAKTKRATDPIGDDDKTEKQ